MKRVVLSFILLAALASGQEYVGKVVSLLGEREMGDFCAIAFNPDRRVLYASDADCDSIWVIDETRSVPDG